jgi:hypothetical protein
MLYLTMKHSWLIQTIMFMCGDALMRFGDLNVLDSKFSAMFWGCITYQGVGTIAEVQGNINSRKYINILDTFIIVL